MASFNGNRHGRLDNRNRTDSNQDAASAGWWKPIRRACARLGPCQPDSRTGDLIRCRRGCICTPALLQVTSNRGRLSTHKLDCNTCRMTSLETFCRQTRARSTEHREAIHLLHGRRLLSQVVAILRQELDSMVRVIFLLSIADKPYRQQLIDASVNGAKWTVKGKTPVSQTAKWSNSHSLFMAGQSPFTSLAAFIHLSSFHDYERRDPLLARRRMRRRLS